MGDAGDDVPATQYDWSDWRVKQEEPVAAEEEQVEPTEAEIAPVVEDTSYVGGFEGRADGAEVFAIADDPGEDGSVKAEPGPVDTKGNNPGKGKDPVNVGKFAGKGKTSTKGKSKGRDTAASSASGFIATPPAEAESVEDMNTVRKNMLWCLRYGACDCGLAIRKDGFVRLRDLAQYPGFMKHEVLQLRDIAAADTERLEVRKIYCLSQEPGAPEGTLEGATSFAVRFVGKHTLPGVFPRANAKNWLSRPEHFVNTKSDDGFDGEFIAAQHVRKQRKLSQQATRKNLLYKTRDCKYYANGTCTAGSSYNFRHPEDGYG